MSDLSVDFLKAFKKEADLRDAIRILLGKMPGVRDVQLTHGVQEIGKDIVFYAPDFMGSLQLHACVIKSTKIDGSVKNSGAREVLTQALQSFDTPYVNREGQNEYVARVFIISPYDCPPTTMHSISGALQQRAGLVKFLCGQALIDRFSEYWPDFLLFNSSALSIYISSVIRNVVGKDPIHFLLKNQQLLSGELESLQNRYVDQGFMKTVHEHVFTLTPAAFTSRSFQHPVTLAAVRTMTADIRALTGMEKTEILNTTEGFGAAISGFERLEGFAQDLVTQWTENYEIYRRTPDFQFASLQKRGDVELPLGSDFHKRWSAEIRIVHDFAVEVQAKIGALGTC